MSDFAPQSGKEWMRQQTKDGAITKRRVPKNWQATIDANAALVALAARNRNRIRNGNNRTNQLGIISPKTLAPREMGFDGWECAGITNLVTNPRAGTNTTGQLANNGTLSRVTTGGPTAAIPSFFRNTMTSTTGSGIFMPDATMTNIVANKLYTVSAYLRSSAALTLTGLDYVLFSGASLVYDGPNTTVTLAANTWQRVTFQMNTFGVPAFTSASIRFLSGASLASGQTLDMTGLMITEGSLLWPYLDGDCTDCAFTGTSHASTSVRGPSTTTLTWTTAPHGQLVTLSSGGGVSQVDERADLEAGTWIVSHAGTATLRVYNVGTDPASLPAFAASPVTVTLDGLDDVVVELRAVGGTKTYGSVQFEKGAIATPFEDIPVQQELAICQRYYYRWTSVLNNQSLAGGFQQITAGAIVSFALPVPMRGQPYGVAASGMFWTDGISFANAITAVSPTDVTGRYSGPQQLWFFAAFSAAGAQRWPGFVTANTAGGWFEVNARLY
jgi:hypothetical protein